MKEATFTIQDRDGIHARPAGILVQRMQGFPCTVTLRKGDRSADGKRLFAVMKLAVRCGETVTLTAEGEREDEAVEAAKAAFAELGL
jgi:phosphocarrier protein HPr